jgi:cation diffusion facilitator CzcD-associated flavoprotein CzcO
MSGIGIAAKLRMAGIDSFHLYEMWDEIGGTWQANTYPGLSCDVPSRNYQYTFAPNPDWSHLFSPGREIWEYINRVADDFGIRERTSLSTEVADATWDDGEWVLTTKDGDVARYDFLISAVGGLVRTRKPDIPGLGDFAGASFHSAEWDHSVPLEGRRIGVIGTGSTGMQITRALAPVAGKFELYQRTPQWIAPVGNREYSRLTKWIYRTFPRLNLVAYNFYGGLIHRTFGTAVVQPGWQRKLISYFCRRHLKKIKDPQLRARFTPKDQPMCKRLIAGTEFYELFEFPWVSLVDTGIDHVDERGIVTSDGVLHELDVIVLATGFDAHAFMLPMTVHGPDGLDIPKLWQGEPFAYRSVALPGFPNLLMLIGPHSPFGNQSLFAISEHQQDFAMDIIERWRRGEIETATPSRMATEAYNDAIRAAMPNTTWVTGCKSWYIGKEGLPHAFPWVAPKHRELLEAMQEEDWEVTPGPAARAGEASRSATAA